MYCGAVTDGFVILYQVKGNDFNTPRESEQKSGICRNVLT